MVALRPLTDLPLLVGVGIGTPEQAGAAGGFADGVIVGSALMACLVEGDRAGMLGSAEGFRAALPTGVSASLLAPRCGIPPPRHERMHGQAGPME